MKRGLNRALFERNARACETAQHPKCTCVCGGALHGKSHLAALDSLWQQYVERIEREIEENDETATQLPGAGEPQ